MQPSEWQNGAHTQSKCRAEQMKKICCICCFQMKRRCSCIQGWYGVRCARCTCVFALIKLKWPAAAALAADINEAYLQTFIHFISFSRTSRSWHVMTRHCIQWNLWIEASNDSGSHTCNASRFATTSVHLNKFLIIRKKCLRFFLRHKSNAELMPFSIPIAIEFNFKGFYITYYNEDVERWKWSHSFYRKWCSSVTIFVTSSSIHTLIHSFIDTCFTSVH